MHIDREGRQVLVYLIVSVVAVIVFLLTLPRLLDIGSTDSLFDREPAGGSAFQSPTPLFEVRQQAGSPISAATTPPAITTRSATATRNATPLAARSPLPARSSPTPPSQASTILDGALGYPDWRLVFSDEFEGSTLDTSKWRPSFWWGSVHKPEELAAYSPNNLEFSDGVLRLRIDKRPLLGFPYSSGMISSHASFSQEFGYFEIRARVPKGKGFWPAFWLNPDKRSGVTWPPEVDVMEVLGVEPNVLNTTQHYLDDEGRHQQSSGRYVGADLSTDFHIYAFEWNPRISVWYLDGLAVWRSPTDRIRGRMYVIANLAAGDWGGNPDSNTVFPSYFDIDFIRIYQIASRLNTVPSPTSTPR